MKTFKKQSTTPKQSNPVFKDVSGVTFSTGVKIKLDNKVIRQMRGD